LATLVAARRIGLDRSVEAWVAHALAGPVEALPVTAEIAVAAGVLGRGFPGDPGDRIIYATARAESVPLVTRDRRLRTIDPDGTLW
jgi:PIN domain nuclease of toxin-antitoxin system